MQRQWSCHIHTNRYRQTIVYVCGNRKSERERENGKLFCTASFSSTNGGCMWGSTCSRLLQISCPNLEVIVKKEVLGILSIDAAAPAALLRLMFYDCQVQVNYCFEFDCLWRLNLISMHVMMRQGCDASILFYSDQGLNDESEMVSARNFGIRNREKIQ